MTLLVWSVALYVVDTCALLSGDSKRQEKLEMWPWRRMERISWVEVVNNEFYKGREERGVQ